MEFKLNKIDTELISKVNRSTKPGKIHKEETVKFNVNTNKKEEEPKYLMETYKKKERKSTVKKDKIEDGTGKYIYVRK